MGSVLLDIAGIAAHRRPCPATTEGVRPENKGEQYPADPPSVEEIVVVMRTVGDRSDGHRLRALIVLLWRAGLRISEALALQESDLDRSRGAVLVRRGKGGRRREVGMDRWAWEQLDSWLEIRRQLPIGALLCVIHGPSAGRRWEARPRANSYITRLPGWIWDERSGAHSNQDDPSVGSGIGEELQIMLNPVALLSSLRFQPTGSSEVAGRPTISAHGIPRPQDTRHWRAFELHKLGTASHRYELRARCRVRDRFRRTRQALMCRRFASD